MDSRSEYSAHDIAEFIHGLGKTLVRVEVEKILQDWPEGWSDTFIWAYRRHWTGISIRMPGQAFLVKEAIRIGALRPVTKWFTTWYGNPAEDGKW